MSFTFSTALAGLQAASQSLNLTGNNIANANTTAFKGASLSFADVFTNSIGVRLNGAGTTLQIGNGVRVSATQINFAQGTLTDSSSPTSSAIEGNGFFVVQDQSGARLYSRDGEFTVDRNGNLVTQSGQRVIGYNAVNGSIPPGAQLAPITVPVGEKLPPVVTTEATFRMNLNASDAAGTPFNAPVQVYDSKGDAHNLEMIFTKQANGSYLLSASLDGNPAQLSVNGGAASATPATFTFDADGQITAPASLSIIPDETVLNGTSLPSIAINLYQENGAGNITNYAAPSGVASTNQDGFSAGDLAGLSLSNDRNGILSAVFSNGQRRPLGQIALAVFNAQNGLRRLGNNLFGETLASGQASIGVAGTGGRGEIVGSALEQSNVDIATEFTELIVAQRSYQANSRVITTLNQTLQELLQII
ncbi:MAG TPA: flagellar hook protein FlgE [Blastocatellia bacterium]|nr:flagellar hook protein FlgE [Blastocatellia bacterium]